ncbi:MAG: type II toxin-antitoxin system VapC family toxin [Rhodospirillales bacterium]
MVVDTSAVVAFLANEKRAPEIERAFLGAGDIRMSAFNVFECRVVLLRQFGDAMVREFELLLARLGVRVEPFDAEQAAVAQEAYVRYGKGMGGGAGLNLGDCAAYALAKTAGLKLLYVGRDFARTDASPALGAQIG